MTLSPTFRGTIAATISTGLLVGLGIPVAAVNIPEGGAVSPGSVQVINFQVQEGCDGMPVDTLEVTIPDSVGNPTPEAVPGWTIETETADDDETITLLRWTGGSMPDESFLEFGMRAGFPDEPDATIEFPVVKRCGTLAVDFAPTVTLQPRLGPRDLLDLQNTVGALSAEVSDLSDRIGNVNAVNLRDRVSDLESSVEALAQRVEDLEEAQ